MPRAFLIKKHSPGREPANGKQHRLSPELEVENENTPSSEDNQMTVDVPPSDGRGPYDLTVKPKRNDDQSQDREIPLNAPIKSPPSVIEFSPKIITSSTITTPPIGIALIDRRTPSPNRLFKPVTPLEPLNPNTPPSSRTPPWHRPFVAPPYPMNFPLYPLPRHASDFYSPPATYIGSIVSPPLVPLPPISPPRSLGIGIEQLSPCIPRENVSPTSHTSPFYTTHPLPDRMHLEQHMGRKELSSYCSPWMEKEGSTSPLSRSDSSDSGLESATSSKSNGLVSSSTLSLPGGQAPRYQCVDCNKSYSTYSGLSRHRQFHCVTQSKKSFNCKYCDKIYVSLGALKMHIRTHTLPCKCKLCGKAFSRPWLLQGHIRTHTGEKPFECTHCSRAFADRSNLRAHLQTHSDIKKYSCKACSKTFSRMSLLLKHTDGGCMASQQR